MKRFQLVLLLIIVANVILAQTKDQYSIKLQGIYGNILPHDKYVKLLIDQPVKGAELSIEFQTMGEKPWHQFQGFPIIGLGAVWLNLGNPEKLGFAYAAYPYISLPIFRSRHFRLNIKGGMGASFLTKTYYNTNKDTLGNLLPWLTGTNAAIGSKLNIYFSGGAAMEIRLSKALSITADYTWNHVSNGSAVAPNSGINMLNSFVGLKYFPNYKKFAFLESKKIADFPRHFTCEIIAAAGFRQLYYKDNLTFPTGSFAVAVFRPVSNFLRVGLGTDAFYDGAYDGHTTAFKRTYLKTNEFKNKIRMGVSLQNELLLGRISAGFHFGVYLYNPLKNLEPVEIDPKTNEMIEPLLNKPIIYPYNIDEEDGWLYTRAAFKYALNRHYFISLGLKTHLQKAEFIEWGLGYKF